MQDLLNQMNTQRARLNAAIAELRKRGIHRAAAERDYRKGLAEKILQEREKGTPVTIISDICRGDPKIAKLKLERDIAEVLYDTNQQAIYAARQEINIIKDFMQAERKGE